MSRAEVARAIAFFEASEDTALLRETLQLIRPRAAAAVRRLEMAGRSAPEPAPIAPAAQPATRQEALLSVRNVQDFGELQALSRAIGRRLEALMQRPSEDS